jgi:hypothetical protein
MFAHRQAVDLQHRVVCGDQIRHFRAVHRHAGVLAARAQVDEDGAA